MVLSETSYNLMKNRNIVNKPINNEICSGDSDIRQKVYFQDRNYFSFCQVEYEKINYVYELKKL